MPIVIPPTTPPEDEGKTLYLSIDGTLVYTSSAPLTYTFTPTTNCTINIEGSPTNSGGGSN